MAAQGSPGAPDTAGPAEPDGVAMDGAAAEATGAPLVPGAIDALASPGANVTSVQVSWLRSCEPCAPNVMTAQAIIAQSIWPVGDVKLEAMSRVVENDPSVAMGADAGDSVPAG
jgi:hypothetical protein